MSLNENFKLKNIVFPFMWEEEEEEEEGKGEGEERCVYMHR